VKVTFLRCSEEMASLQVSILEIGLWYGQTLIQSECRELFHPRNRPLCVCNASNVQNPTLGGSFQVKRVGYSNTKGRLLGTFVEPKWRHGTGKGRCEAGETAGKY
jgi:hypothetical protein